MKIRPLEAELFHAGGRAYRQAEMTKLVAFRNFANAPKKCPSKMSDKSQIYEVSGLYFPQITGK